jgi:hypothetical protein
MGARRDTPAVPPGEERRVAHDRLRRAAGFGRRHAVFVGLLAAGIALRVVTLVAYRPALFSPDSPGYIDAAERWILPSLHPLGYPLFLRTAFTLWDDYRVLPLLQHLMGIGIAVLLYATLVRLGVRHWLAGLAAAPVLLDAYQLNIEQYVLSDTLFELFLAAGCAALLWQRPLPPALAALGGVLFAAAAVTRSVGLLVVVPIAIGILVLRPRRTAIALLAAGFLLPVVAYASAFKVANGSFGLTAYTGTYLYGRVVEWADCSKFSPKEYARPLCPGEHEELDWIYQYLWAKRSPLYDVQLPPGKSRSDVAGDFATRAILAQPLTYARNVAADSLLTFAPAKHTRRGEFRVSQWQFQTRFPIPDQQPGWTVEPPRASSHGTNEGSVDTGLARFLRTYQRFGYLPGPFLAACLLVALAAAVGAGRARSSGLRGPIAFLLALAIALCFGSVAATMFAWRYQLPQLILLPPAAALGITALMGWQREAAAAAGSSRRGPQPTAQTA